MNNELEMWIEMNGASIISDRDTLKGESLYACAINNHNGQVLSLVHYQPSDAQMGHYRWPKFFSDTINQASDSIRAGKKIGETFKTHDSGYPNKLWHSNLCDIRVFTTACHLDNWITAGSIESAANLLPDSSIIIKVKDSSTGHILETLTFHPTKSESTQYNWPFFLSHFINTNSVFLRAGEKNLETRLITPLFSSYENTLWLPAHSALTVTLEHALAEQVKTSANTVHGDLIYKLRSTPPGQSEIDHWISMFNSGRFSDIKYPSGKKINPAPLYTHLQRAQSIANYIARNQASAPERYIECAVDALNFYSQQNYDPANW